MVHETGYNPARGRRRDAVCLSYLRVQIIDLGDSSVDVASMDSLSYFYARLNELLFERKLNVRFFGELLCSSGIPLADQIVHDDKVDVTDYPISE